MSANTTSQETRQPVTRFTGAISAIVLATVVAALIGIASATFVVHDNGPTRALDPTSAGGSRVIREYGSAPGDETAKSWAAGYQAYAQAMRADRGSADWAVGYQAYAQAMRADRGSADWAVGYQAYAQAMRAGDETAKSWAAGYQAYAQAMRADRGSADWAVGYSALANAEGLQ